MSDPGSPFVVVREQVAVPATQYHPGYRIERVAPNSTGFRAVLALRALSYGRPEAGLADAIDEYSLHFAAVSHEKTLSAAGAELPLGALRVTCRKLGRLESEEFYPPWLLEEFGSRLGAASRMCVRPDHKGTSLPEQLAKHGWRAALAEGVRLDVSKARIRAIPFYLRLGYVFVRKSIFTFNRWDTKCGLIALPANRHHPSRLAPLFAGVADPCDLTASPNSTKFSSSLEHVHQDCSNVR
jgi:GNAT superfamily N-acetyltransferase